MDHFAGLDVSVKVTSVCIVDDAGKIVREVKVASEPEALLAVLKNPAYHFKRIGLEVGPLQWLFGALAEAEFDRDPQSSTDPQRATAAAAEVADLKPTVIVTVGAAVTLVAGLSAFALVAPEAGETGSSGKLPELGTLSLRAVDFACC